MTSLSATTDRKQYTAQSSDSQSPGEERRKKVLLVDDHSVVRAGLASLINEERDFVTCGEADNDRTALDGVRKLQPDAVVVDWTLGNKDAAELVRALRTDYPDLPMLVLSMHDEVFYAERALRAGANGYVMKQEASTRIVEAIRSVLAGRRYLSERASRSIGGSTHAWPEQSAAAEIPTAAAGTAGSGRDVPTLSIVIPVFNSEATISLLVEKLIDELEGAYQLQIVLVDDGSSDGSPRVCRAIQNAHPKAVDFITLSRNFGEHNAVMAGLNCADGDYCVIMDDDFQNPPSEVRHLVDELRKGHDVVYVRYDEKRHSIFRNLGSRLHNWTATQGLGKPSSLYLSSFKAMTRFLVREAVHFTGPDPHLDAIILRTTRKIGVVKAHHEPRKNGTSGYNLGKLISLFGNMIVPFSLYPLRLLGLYGLVMVLIGGAYGVYTLTSYLSPSLTDPDSLQQLNASIWFFQGVHLLAIAIVGEYVGRIHRQLTRDPQFIVRNIVRRQFRE